MGDWFADAYSEVLASVFEHFRGKVNHFDIEFDAQFFATLGEFVEERRIMSVEMHGDDVAFEFRAFRDECFFPFEVGYFAVFLAKS